MKYAEYLPTEQLKPYIDAYWVLETDSLFKPVQRRIFADGCTEIFINIGSSIPIVNNVTKLMPGNIYLGGTMTCSNVVSSLPNTTFVGIRFKPAGFSIFYKLPVEQIVDEIIEFPDKNLMHIIDVDQELNLRLDQFFINKINPLSIGLIPLTKTVDHYKGIISVDFLAKEHNLTTRTLERSFKKEIGISPKAFINIVKFIHANQRIQNNISKKSLLQIAYEMGYYDHSHLAKDVKKFTGLNPSEIGI
jgi:AraC-like DNA-binding protein